MYIVAIKIEGGMSDAIGPITQEIAANAAYCSALFEQHKPPTRRYCRLRACAGDET
jgi:hypothetical protein